mgnify:FL=1
MPNYLQDTLNCLFLHHLYKIRLALSHSQHQVLGVGASRTGVEAVLIFCSLFDECDEKRNRNGWVRDCNMIEERGDGGILWEAALCINIVVRDSRIYSRTPDKSEEQGQ